MPSLELKGLNLVFSQKSGWRFLGWSLFVVIVDQITKFWAVDALMLHESIEVLPFFNITLAHNYGAAFSFLADQSGWQKFFFAAIAFVVSVGILIWLKVNSSQMKWQNFALAFVLGGAIGNLIDRLYYGYVVDFLDIYFSIWNYSFPTFNLADSAIVLGAGLLLLDSFKPLDGNVDAANSSEQSE